jgi:hypothetical protein
LLKEGGGEDRLFWFHVAILLQPKRLRACAVHKLSRRGRMLCGKVFPAEVSCGFRGLMLVWGLLDILM